MTIETANLKLIPCGLAHFEAMLRDERELAALLDAEPAEEWLGFAAAREAMAPAYERLKSDPAILGWWTYLFVHVPDKTEAARGMIAYAFSHPHVTRIDAHTLPERNPSTAVLEKVGMKLAGPAIDPDEGEVWRWSLSQSDCRSA